MKVFKNYCTWKLVQGCGEAESWKLCHFLEEKWEASSKNWTSFEAGSGRWITFGFQLALEFFPFNFHICEETRSWKFYQFLRIMGSWKLITKWEVKSWTLIKTRKLESRSWWLPQPWTRLLLPTLPFKVSKDESISSKVHNVIILAWFYNQWSI